jgi:hypothetical protein
VNARVTVRAEDIPVSSRRDAKLDSNVEASELGARDSAIRVVPERSRDSGVTGAQWGAAAAAVALLIVYGLATNRVFVRWDTQEEVFLRLAMLLALSAGAVSVARHVWDSASTVKANWWNIGGNLDDPTWEDVRRMTIGAEADDPLVVRPIGSAAAGFIRAAAAYVILGCILIEAASVVVVGPILPRLLTSHAASVARSAGAAGVSLELSANLTALLALAAAAVSIYFTHRQLQAKVKADSRQAWIVKLRARIADFIALAGTIHENGTSSMDQNNLNRRRLEMELMLNPSEKDHRLLMYLSLRMAFFEGDEQRFAEVHDVRNIRAAIKGSDQYNEEAWRPLLGAIPEKLPEDRHDKAFSDLVGYTMRLAHVVLKREWQRVKATR